MLYQQIVNLGAGETRSPKGSNGAASGGAHHEAEAQVCGISVEEGRQVAVVVCLS